MTTRTPSPLDRLELELGAAAARQVAATRAAEARTDAVFASDAARATGSAVPARDAAHAGARPARRGRWWTRHTLVAFLVVGVGSAGAVAVAATALLQHGGPVPLRGGKPVAGKSNGAPTPGSIRYLTTSVPDPDGGPPWAMRYWTTDRGYACFQVGRYDAGHVGLINGAGPNRTFHPLQLGTSKDGVSGCFPADRAGHARIAIHQATSSGGGSLTACQDNVYTADRSGHTVRAVFPPGCHQPTRTVDVGLLGPAARKLTMVVGGKQRVVTPIGPEGAYLTVQHYVKPQQAVMGFRHKDPKLNMVGTADQWIALTPAAHTVRDVTYDDGVCRVRVARLGGTNSGACLHHAAWARFPELKTGDVKAPVRVWAIDDKRIRVRFTAREAVTDRRSGYSVALIPERVDGGPAHEFTVYDYEHDIRAGETARMTLSRSSYRAGRFTVRVQFRTAPNGPSLSELPWQQGPIVGVRHVQIG